MLADPKAEALIENFAGQWLYIRAIDDAAPDAWYFPDFDETLRDSMRTEMQHFVRSLFLDDKSLLELLTSDTSWVDARLAAHYGITDFQGDGFEPQSMTPYNRGGLLTKSGWLMSRSYPTRTSPVKRGKWVLEELLCSPPPPPPPGVEGLPEGDAEGTVRERLEQHAQLPVCAACHQAMDPLGFGLEHFDGIGAFRDYDTGAPVDATGELPDGSTFDGALELQAILANDERVPSCMAEKLFVYALGRGIRHSDEAYLDDIEDAFRAGGYRLEALLKAIVTSPPFTMRRGESP